MKRILLFALVIFFGMTVYAQPNRAVIPKALANKAVPAPFKIAEDYMPVMPGNDVVAPKGAPGAGTAIGGTRYDMQTNGSPRTQLYYLPETGNLGAAWIRGMTDAGTYPDRGTGYNYFGTSWGPAPTTRIETLRTGWGEVLPWNNGGELCISHQGTGGLVKNTRPVKGTGTWTQSIITAPAGAYGILWPRTITNGATNNNIHIIALTTPTANSGTVYMGLDGAIVYYRSLDGGATWDKNAVIIDPMTSSNYFGFGGDDYAWGAPHGDTLCFIVGGNWTDTFIMKSYDNGSTWTKVQVLSNAHQADNTSVVADPFYASDGSNCVEMDKDGIFHVAFGRMRASNDGSGRVYYPYTDGLVYWNTAMAPLKDSLDLDTLYNNGQLLAYVYANTAGDSILAVPYYGVGLTSFPQLTIDKCGYVYAIWSGVTVGNPYNGLNYRHIWEKHSLDAGVTFSDSNDFNKGLAYIYKEFAYPSMAKAKPDGKIRFVYQTADVPGSAIKDATNVTAHDCVIEEREETLAFPPCPGVGIESNTQTRTNQVAQNVPNPFHGITTIDVTLAKPASLSIEVYNVMGQKVMNVNKGNVSAGPYQFVFDGNQMNSGVYFYTVKINNESYTHKMIVE